ncbi:MAG: hypothetical protein ACI4TK_15800 [Agathobacter sp.]
MINVSGFLFEDEEMAAQAKREEEGVRFIKEKSSLKTQESVLKLYTTLLQQKLFVTPVGLRFLMELQGALIASGMKKEDIPVLDVAAFVPDSKTEGKKSVKKSDSKRSFHPVQKINNRVEKGSGYKQAFYVALFFAIVFGISVAGMFVIAEASSDNITILNYEEKLIDKYEQWHNDLKEKEESLKKWENELSEREEALKDSGEN